MIDSIIREMLQSECACSVLEISGFDSRYGRLVNELQGGTTQAAELEPGSGCRVDRIDLSGTGSPGTDGVYGDVSGAEALSDISRLRQYDVIIVFHLFENMPAPDAKAVLKELLAKAVRQVLVVTPEYPYDLQSDEEDKKSEVRAYHPLFFLGMDFSYKMLDTSEERLQVYSFFPKPAYKPLPIDRLLHDKLQDEKAGKLNIAYIVTHHMPTGGMKVFFSQMKEMAKSGHHVTAYYRSDKAERAVPEWCGIAGGDLEREIIVPEGAGYQEYINKDEDIILLNWMETLHEFEDSDIPVALWENGTPALFGDYGRLVSSDSWQRKQLHRLYRIPAYLLAVSRTVQEILKGVYGRESQYYPNGVDTGLYRPATDKDNEIPVVLLVGNPTVNFKGFRSVFRVLETAREMGDKFKVRIAAQQEFSLVPEPSFDLEKFINPPQEKLAELYRNADMFMSASLYEAYAMPPIEAMASGTAVIAMDCGGINTYAEPGVNCLLCEQGDVRSMLYAFTYLLSDPGARKRLAAAGRETALRHSHQNIIPGLERCLYRIAGGNRCHLK